MPHALTRTIKAGLAVVLLFTLFPPVALDAAEEVPGARDTSNFACPPAEVPDAGFTDTGGNHFEEQIDCLAWYGITSGGPQGRPASQYGPELQVRRDQMATFIARMIDYIDPGAMAPYDGQNAFIDVPDDSVHAESINRLNDVGVVEGGPGGRPADEYGPGLAVNRAQMASFINRAIGVVSGSRITTSTDYFDDDNGSPHEENINGLAAGGVVEGVSFGVYAPTRDVLRDAMSAFIMRAVDMQVEADDTRPPTSVRLTAIEVDDADADGAMSEGDLLILRFNGNMLAGEGTDPARVTLVDVEGDSVTLATDEEEEADAEENDGVTPATVSGSNTASLTFEVGADVDVKPDGDGVFDNAFELTRALGITDFESRPWVPQAAEGEWPGPPPVGNQEYPGTPADEAVLTVGEEREFSFAGVAVPVTVSLIPCAEVDVIDGFATFSDDEPNDAEADHTGETLAYIVSVNGVPNASEGSDQVDYSGSSGNMTVVIGSDVPTCVRPLVYSNSDRDGDLDLAADDTPAENHGHGGETVWLPFASTSSTDAADGRVGFVDKKSNRIAVNTGVTGLGNAGPGDTDVTYIYDENDDFMIEGASATFAEFESAISRGDGLTVGVYSAAETGTSEFDISGDGPAVLSMTATAGGGGVKEDSVLITVIPSNPSVIELYDSFLIERAEVTGDGTGAYTVVGNIPEGVDADSEPTTWSYIDANVPAGTWRYRVSGIIDGDQSPTITDDATTVAIGPKSVHAWVLEDNTVAGSPDADDVLQVWFDEPVSVGTGTRIFVVEGEDMADSGTDEEQMVITCGFGANCELNTTIENDCFGEGTDFAVGTVLTITLTGAPPKTGETDSFPGSVRQYPLTAYQSDVTDPTGVPWDLVASADKTFQHDPDQGCV